MGRRTVITFKNWRVGVVIALLAASACSGSDDAAVDDTDEGDQPTSSIAADEADEVGDDGSSTGDGDASTDPADTEQPTGPLGFTGDVFDVPIPADTGRVVGAFENSNELIDAGVDAGVWTEVEGVRALVSVVMGELPPEAIPALDELPRFHYSEVIDRAVGLLDDPTIADDSAADLARLVAFFTADSLTAGEAADTDSVDSDGSEEGASGLTQPVSLVGVRPLPEQTRECKKEESPVRLYRPREKVDFGAEPTRRTVCYERFEEGDDVVYISDDEKSVDISSLIFDVIEKARPGYVALAGEELQPVEVLVSIRLSPKELDTTAEEEKRERETGKALAHVASAVTSKCRVAIFASDTLSVGTAHLEFTIAHELFHCIQGLWNGDAIPGDFITEAGADYFAYEVLDRLCTDPQVALGAELDVQTTSGSLLDVSYEGWFFWAFLSEHQGVSPQLIAEAHRAIENGTPIEDTLFGLMEDPPKSLNEFYVRLVGPGLACDFKGSQTTDKIDIEKKGKFELPVFEVWQGTRYQLNYFEKKLFEQHGDDAGPIGMAEFGKLGDEDEWVTTEPEVRSTCKEKEMWMVVVSPLSAAPTQAGPRKLEVDEVKPGGCDPCLIGSWSVDMESYQARFNSRSPIDVKISGSYTLTFEPGPPVGGLEFSDREQTLMEFPSLGFGIDGGSAGDGTYTAIDGNLASQGYIVSGAGSAVGLPIPIDTTSPWSASGDGGAPYICDVDDLTIMFDDASLDATRMPATPEGDAYFG